MLQEYSCSVILDEKTFYNDFSPEKKGVSNIPSISLDYCFSYYFHNVKDVHDSLPWANNDLYIFKLTDLFFFLFSFFG